MEWYWWALIVIAALLVVVLVGVLVRKTKHHKIEVDKTNFRLGGERRYQRPAHLTRHDDLKERPSSRKPSPQPRSRRHEWSEELPDFSNRLGFGEGRDNDDWPSSTRYSRGSGLGSDSNGDSSEDNRRSPDSDSSDRNSGSGDSDKSGGSSNFGGSSFGSSTDNS